MGEVVRGQIADRPWGLTFGQFGLRAVSGQLTVNGDGREFCVAFANGRIVGATSLLAADAATRIAMTVGLISSSQARIVARQISATPEIDEIALLASACRLDAAQLQKLRQRVMVQRAARTFSIEEGTFVLADEIAIPTSTDAEVDIRAVVYHGARMNLSETRLSTELRDLGSYFTLNKNALEHAEQFGLDALEWPILDALRERTTLPELEARHRDIDPRNVQSVIYALVSCRECMVEQEQFASPRTTSQTGVAVSFKPTRDTLPRPASGSTSPLDAQMVATARTSTLRQSTRPGSVGDAPLGKMPPAIEITRAMTPRPSPYGDDVGVPRATATGSQNAMPPVRPSNATTAPPPESRVRTPTQNTPPPEARVLTPPLRPRTTSANPAVARTVSNPAVARTTSASGSFSMPRTISQSATGEFSAEGSDRTRQALADAADAFKLGQDALRDNQVDVAIAALARASSLNPHEFDYSAVLAFAQFVGSAAGERTKAADKVRKMLNHAIQKSRDPEQARFYVGQVEQLLGHNKEALVHYQAILRAVPDHPQALTAVQTIEDKALEKSGFGGLFRKK